MALRLNGSTSGYVELNAPAVAGSTSLTVPYGIVQVVSENYTSRFASSGGGWSTITNFNATITPKFSSSTILVMVHIGLSANSSGNMSSAFRMQRNGTTTLVGVNNGGASRDVASVRTQSGTNNDHGYGVVIIGEDSPGSTSALTYSVQVNPQGTTTSTVNYEHNNNNDGDAYSMDTISNITLMEVAG